MLLGGQTLSTSSGAVRSDAILAPVGNADRHINEFLGERVERSRSHDFLRIRPHAPERWRMMRQYLPIIIDPIRLADRHDVVVYRTHVGRRLRIFNRRRRRACFTGSARRLGGAHGTTAMTRSGKPEPSSTLGKVTQTTAPDSGTWSKLANSSI